MLFLENVAHLTIRDVTLERSAFWTVHMVGCRDVLIDGIRRHFGKYVFHAMADMPFVIATLGNDAGAYGAFKLALDAFL